MKKEILGVMRYFAFFNYPPTLEEIHTFLPIKTTKKRLQETVDKMVNKKLLTLNFALLTERYTLPQYSSFFGKKAVRTRNSLNKIKRIKMLIKIISLFPQIKLVGLSGTVAMMNAGRSDDVDLFIITAKNRLWTGRFLAVFLAQLIGLRRKRGERQAKDKVCLNLFFDEKDLSVPKFKQTSYVAHEILQIKTLINKDDTLSKLYDANKWLFDMFPNALRASAKLKAQSASWRTKFKITIQNSKLKNFKLLTLTFNFSLLNFNSIANRIETILRKFQLNSINKHKTKEIITNTQLWFFPEDFEQLLPTNRLG